MNTVYNLWYTREYEDREDTLLHIGIYATAKDCEEVIEKLSDKLGFRDYPEGFSFEAVTLGSTGWQEGFVTVYYPAKEREAEDFPAIPEGHKS